MKSLGLSIIRWQSSGSLVALRRLFTTGGPMVMLGTKWPSITSTWTVVPPPRSAAAIWSARRAKSAERMEGSSSTMGFVENPLRGQCIRRRGAGSLEPDVDRNRLYGVGKMQQNRAVFHLIGAGRQGLASDSDLRGFET